MDLMLLADSIRDGDTMTQQDPPAVPFIARTDGDTGHLGNQGGLKGILEQDGRIKVMWLKILGKGQGSPYPSLIKVLFIIDKELIHIGTEPEDISYPGDGEHGDFSIREIFPDAVYGRRGHHRITYPVGGTDQDLAGIQLYQRRFRGHKIPSSPITR